MMKTMKKMLGLAAVLALSLCANAADTYEVSKIHFWPGIQAGGPSGDAIQNYTTMYVLTQADYQSWDKSRADLEAKAFIKATDYPAWKNNGFGPEQDLTWADGMSEDATITVRDTTASGTKAVIPDPNGDKGKGHDPDYPYELILASETDWYAIHDVNAGSDGTLGIEPYVVGMAHGEFVTPTEPTEPTVPVTLDAQGGEGGTASVTATYGQPMPAATMPTKTGYTFGGYFDADGKKYYNADGTSAANWDKTAAATLTAQWTVNTYHPTITWGGDIEDVVTEVTYGEVPAAVEVPERTGYAFKGVYTEPEGKGTQVYDETGTASAPWTTAEDAKLYAFWQELPPQFALVSAKQRWPWNGKVDVTYTAANLNPAGVYKVEVEVKVKKGEDEGEGEGWMVKSILVDIPSENGTKKLVADLDGVLPAETLDDDAQLKLRLIRVK